MQNSTKPMCHSGVPKIEVTLEILKRNSAELVYTTPPPRTPHYHLLDHLLKYPSAPSLSQKTFAPSGRFPPTACLATNYKPAIIAKSSSNLPKKTTTTTQIALTTTRIPSTATTFISVPRSMSPLSATTSTR